MTTYDEKLREHCQKILENPIIKNKIVVLCEGEGSIFDVREETVEKYSNMNDYPDADFYTRCLPKYWTQYKPQFFNSCGRTNVIDTYFKLLELHQEEIQKPIQERLSYLHPDKLYALVDLDLNSQKLENYDFKSTEEIFSNLYQQARVNEATANNHRIWVTGLIHKEAYFIIPELQGTFDYLINSPVYQGKVIALENIYIDMIEAIVNDEELKNCLPIVSNRVNHCSQLDCSSVKNLRDSWKDGFNNSANEEDKNQLIYGLLMFKKAKNFWEQIKPPNDWNRSEQSFKQYLMREIAKFYSEQTDYTKYHIPYFLQTLRKLVTNI
jgi:hypothetical protein